MSGTSIRRSYFCGSSRKAPPRSSAATIASTSAAESVSTKSNADRRDNLVGAEMHREQTVRPLDARMGARDRADRRDHFRRSRLTDEEPLGLAGEEHGHDAEQDPDADR